MSVKDVVVVSVPVSDQEWAKDFYVNKLGFDLKRDDASVPGMRWVQVGADGASTTLTLVTWFDSMPPGSLRGLVFASDDLETDYASLVARGVEFESPPQQQPWGTEAVFHDPDGNQFVLQAARADQGSERSPVNSVGLSAPSRTERGGRRVRV
jgi:predicted enzyme related to lactoylglutathione lyase